MKRNRFRPSATARPDSKGPMCESEGELKSARRSTNGSSAAESNSIMCPAVKLHVPHCFIVQRMLRFSSAVTFSGRKGSSTSFCDVVGPLTVIKPRRLGLPFTYA